MVSRSLPFHRTGGMDFVAWDPARTFAGAEANVTFLTTRIPERPTWFEEEDIVVHALQEADPGRYSGEWWRGSSERFRNQAGEVNFGTRLDRVLSRMLTPNLRYHADTLVKKSRPVAVYCVLTR